MLDGLRKFIIAHNGVLINVYLEVVTIFEGYSDVVTIKELAEMLQIKVYRAYQLVQEKRIRRLDIGKPYLIPKSEVIRFVKESVLE